MRGAKSVLLWILVLALAAVALWLACRRVSWREMWNVIRQARAGYLLLGAAVSSVSYLIRSARWRVLLSAERSVRLGDAHWANMAGYLGNFYLPARAGEVLRSVLLGRRTGISSSYVFATAVTERVADALALAFFGVAAVRVLAHLPGWLTSAATFVGVLAVGGLLVLYAAARGSGFLTRLLERLPVVPAAVRARIVRLAEEFLVGARAIHQLARATAFAGGTVVIWLLDALASVCVAWALGLSLTLPQALLLNASLGIASTVPSTPGAVGIYQLVAVGILMPLGFSRSSALAYILVNQACAYVFVTFWGGLGLWRLHVGPQGTPGATRDAETAKETLAGEVGP